MSQYKHAVAKQRLLLEAEEWSKTIKTLHLHSLQSMWYDDRPQDTADGKMVVDREFNNGLIERTLSDGSVVIFGKKLVGDDLIMAYTCSQS